MELVAHSPRARKPTTAATTAVRVAWGAVLTACPAAVLRRCPRTPASTAADTVVRLLGARHVVQGLATAAGVVPAAWTVVPDGLHAATMAGLALGSERWRTAACVDLAVATAFAAAGLRATRTAPAAGRPRHRR
ncbi:hypothetical protein SAMN04490357_6744 [Streptomyces misionensis]|uniref:Uncharacterized protein n=1 Tax=Streptomyces misionensis TaxID=67331 RepID=A0A1H5FNJ6_9ACTN|nr:hypothetical protein [Streptomyces misionensis]SEE04969.1 hypothetical protein SAMN04490357_6744 [Streptomyces misionensis]